ncbi:MAG TPA: site-2 protease family protein [Thermoanaerobaculia bacterium]|jgi:Zn-dependent protease
MLHLGTIRGSTIAVDSSFIILCVFFVALNFNAQRGIEYALIWIPVLFISVLIHEFAHAAMFGMFGYGASEIVLGGMGGHTMNRNHQTPKAWHDFIISGAGPISNFAIMGAAIGLMNVPRLSADPFFQALLPLLAGVNFFWGMLNLIPLKPLDGGHVIRSFTRLFMKDRPSFVVSIWIGIVVGALCALYFAVSRQFFLALFIAWYVFMNFQAWQEFKERGYPGD